MGTLVASSASPPPPLHQNRRCPGWYMTLDGPPPEEALPPAVLGMPRGQKRLNGRFWGHCVGEAVGAPRTPGGRASSGGGPPRVIYNPGQRRFWCNGGELFALEATNVPMPSCSKAWERLHERCRNARKTARKRPGPFSRTVHGPILRPMWFDSDAMRA